MQNVLKLILGVGALLILLAKPCNAELESTTLENLVKISQYIVVGKVVKITVVEKVNVAEVQVIQTLKGESRIKKLYYLAQGTWECDISAAKANETALLFLSKADSFLHKHPKFRKKIEQLTQNSPFLRISWSGHGRMPLARTGKTEYVALCIGDVILPASVNAKPGPEPDDSSIASVPLKEILRFIETKLEEQEREKKARMEE